MHFQVEMQDKGRKNMFRDKKGGYIVNKKGRYIVDI